MANIDDVTNPSNGALRDLEEFVKTNAVFRGFINRLQPNKLNDGSFIQMIKVLNEVDPTILVASNFINAIEDLHRKDDDIITNGKFSDAIQVMDPGFLKSREFAEFLDRLDPNLLERRDSSFSFSGQIRPEYIAVLAASIDRTVLDDQNFTSFVNSIDLDSFQDSSFSSFIARVGESLLQDEDFTEPLSILPSEVLTNSQFTNNVLDFSVLTLSNDIFGETLSEYDPTALARRDSGYTFIEEKPFVVVNPDQGGVSPPSDLVIINTNLVEFESFEQRNIFNVVFDRIEIIDIVQETENQAELSTGLSITELSREVNFAPARTTVQRFEEISPSETFTFRGYLGTPGEDIVDLANTGAFQYIDVGSGSDNVTLFGGAQTDREGLIARDALIDPLGFIPGDQRNTISDLVLNPRLVKLGQDSDRDVVFFKDLTDGLLVDLGTFFGLGEFAVIQEFNPNDDTISLPGARGSYDIVYDGIDTNIFYNNSVGVQDPTAGTTAGIQAGFVHIATIQNAGNLQQFVDTGAFEFR